MGFRKIDKEVFKKLCENRDISDTEIADKFGVSRNAVSLMIKTLGIQGRGMELVRVRAVKRRERLDEEARQEIYQTYPALHEVAAKAKELGIEFEILLHHHRASHWFRLGSKECYILKAKAHKCLGRDTYSGIRRPSTRRRNYDVVVVQVRNGWLVLPKDKLPETTTTCVIGRDRILPGGNNKRHDCNQYFYPDFEWVRNFAN